MVDKDKVGKIKNLHKKFLPIFDLREMVIQSDFKGEIKEGKIHWQPSDALGGYF